MFEIVSRWYLEREWAQTLSASQDPVAHDYTGMMIIDKKRIEKGYTPIARDAVHIKTASNLGLGQADPDNIELIHEKLG